MGNQQEPTNNKDKKERIPFIESLLSRGKSDEEYIPDLKEQWSDMTSGEKVKFVFGALFGLILFVGSLVLVYILLMRMMG